MQKWKEIKKELLKNSEVKAEFDKNDDELILDMIKARQNANLTQSQIAEKMGVSQSTIANKLRLLNLAPEVLDALLQNKIGLCAKNRIKG